MPFANTAPLRREIEARLPERPFAIEFWDGSRLASTDEDGPVFSVRSPKALAHALRAPGQLGLGRAYVSGELDVDDIDKVIRVLDGWQPPSLDGAGKRALMLAVSAPFHCALMQPAAEVMAEALSKVTVSAPAVPLVSNVKASAISDPAEIVQGLVHLADRPVDLRDRGVEPLGGGADRGRQQHVVGVKEEDEVAATRLEPGVDGGRLAAGLLEHRLDALAVALDHLARVVARAVVDDDHLRVAVVLRQRAVDRIADEASVVVVVQDHARAHRTAHPRPDS